MTKKGTSLSGSMDMSIHHMKKYFLTRLFPQNFVLRPSQEVSPFTPIKFYNIKITFKHKGFHKGIKYQKIQNCLPYDKSYLDSLISLFTPY